MPDLTRFPLPLHDSPGGVAVRAKQQMTDFVGYEAMTQPQNYGELKLGIVIPRENVLRIGSKRWREPDGL